MAESVPTFRRGDEIEIQADRAAFEGRAIGRYGDLVVFLEGAVPGDRVRAFVYRKKKSFAEARVIEVLDPSPSRVSPVCTHFGLCGGCAWQHLAYVEQLRWKQSHVEDAFHRIGGFDSPPVREILPADPILYYRNKMEYSFGDRRWFLEGEEARPPEAFALGLHVPGRFDRILHIDACCLQSPESNAILNETRRWFLSRGEVAYSTKSHTGNLRHLVIREGKKTGERMVFLLTSGEQPDHVAEYAERLRAPEFGVTTLVHGVTQRPSSVAIPDTEEVLFGPGVIEECIGDVRFRISPTSFFQTNSIQAERLYQETREALGATAEMTIWDLYCGTGTIGIFLASSVRQVLGVELNPASIQDAEINAARNGLSNISFLCADVLAFMRNAPAMPDAIVLDPPRSGLHPDAARIIASSGVPRIVYVSCNPATAARDCAVFREQGYTIPSIRPVDMFPHTWHVESVITLQRDDTFRNGDAESSHCESEASSDDEGTSMTR